jgi:hypothetical protein
MREEADCLTDVHLNRAPYTCHPEAGFWPKDLPEC